MMKYFILLVVLATVNSQRELFECFSDSVKGEDVHMLHDIMTLNDKQTDFSLKLFQIVNSFYGHDNIFFSPYSTYHALLLAYFLAANSTLLKLQRTLNLNENMTKLQIYNAYVLDQNRGQSVGNGVQFKSANKIYLEKSLQARPCMMRLFDQEFNAVDFNKHPNEARLMINNWVQNYTNNMIKDLLTESAINSNTKLALVNAAYFKGIWKHQFDKTLTNMDIFYEDKYKQTLTEMMQMEKIFNYALSEDLQASMIQLPYKDNKTSMFIILPFRTSKFAFSNVLEKLNGKNLHKILDGKSFSEIQVDLKLPKFDMEQEIQLRYVLEALGIGDLFSPSADLSELTGKPELTIEDGIHKARINVNEEGSEAAAATALFTFRSSRPSEPTTFYCNRPFIYFIYDSHARSILFQGIYRRPAPLKN